MADLIGQVQTHLEPGETTLATVSGQYEKVKPNGEKEHIRSCVLLATDRRVVFYAKKVTGHDFETLAYSLVTSIVQGKNLLGNNVTVIAAGVRVEVKWIKDGKALGQFVEIVRSHMAANHGAASPSLTTPAADDPIEQLRKLGELRDAGVITPEEFATKKGALMDRI